jgi:L-serine/L-threonine ammonia-lyase
MTSLSPDEQPLHVRTPLIRSRALEALLAKRVYLKLENTQPTGSFKLRGIGRLCQKAARDGSRAFVSSSGGNAGLAAAYAARELGLPITVVTPESTSERMRACIAAEGAEVLVAGAHWAHADARARSIAAQRNATYVPPFDHEELWAGHASLVSELAQEIGAPDLCICSVGGGGLLTGVIDGLTAAGWNQTRVLGVETHGAASFAAALLAGGPVTLPEVRTIAKNLGAARVAQASFDRAQAWGVQSHLVDDAAALRACRRFLDDHRMLVEPACGAALAAAYDAAPALAAARSLVIIICGGACITLAELDAWSSDLREGSELGTARLRLP